MAIRTEPIRHAYMLIQGVEPRCRKVSRKSVEVGDFPATATVAEIEAAARVKLEEARGKWKSVEGANLNIQPAELRHTLNADGSPALLFGKPDVIRLVTLMCPEEVRLRLM